MILELDSQEFAALRAMVDAWTFDEWGPEAVQPPSPEAITLARGVIARASRAPSTGGTPDA